MSFPVRRNSMPAMSQRSYYDEIEETLSAKNITKVDVEKAEELVAQALQQGSYQEQYHPVREPLPAQTAGAGGQTPSQAAT